MDSDILSMYSTKAFVSVIRLYNKYYIPQQYLTSILLLYYLCVIKRYLGYFFFTNKLYGHRRSTDSMQWTAAVLRVLRDLTSSVVPTFSTVRFCNNKDTRDRRPRRLHVKCLSSTRPEFQAFVIIYNIYFFFPPHNIL